MADSPDIIHAKSIMDDFAKRTGLISGYGDVNRRYLWTDAIAVRSFFGLSHILNNKEYFDLALDLIDKVHHSLGKFNVNDHRSGWISGLSEEEGTNHPTVAGLRIGKKLCERSVDDPHNEYLEWDRDGQYFHYSTRWINTLFAAYKETSEIKYAQWASDMTAACGKFISERYGDVFLYWKMSIDLTRPLVKSMGFHDPMEGYLCAKLSLLHSNYKNDIIKEMLNKLDHLCDKNDWSTNDALGIGGLLLNTLRASYLLKNNVSLPESLHPNRLFNHSIKSLNLYSRILYKPKESSKYRLSFRECGLSLGLRTIFGLKNELYGIDPSKIDVLERFLPLCDDIESFWLDPKNQKDKTWKDHLDINEVTLAASIISRVNPSIYT